MSRQLTFLLTILLLSHFSSLHATDDGLINLSLEELLEVQVGIATGKQQRLIDAPAVVTVITDRDISAMGARDLDEVLAAVPGFHVSLVNMNNGRYFIRGMNSINNSNMLLLMNGEPLKRAVSGSQGVVWAGMPVNAIKRVEVMRSPGAAVYGADAFAGIINIVTKTAADIDGTEVGSRIGSYATHDAWLLHGSQWQTFEIAFSFEYFETDGYPGLISADVQSTFDQAFGTQVSKAPNRYHYQREGIDSHLDMRWGNWLWHTTYQGRYDLGSGIGTRLSLDPEGWFADRRLLSNLIYHNTDFNEFWELQAKFTYGQFKQSATTTEIQPGAILPSGLALPSGSVRGDSFGERQYRLAASAFYAGFEQHLLRIGVGYDFFDIYEVHSFANQGLDANGQLLSPNNAVLVDLQDTPYSAIPEGIRKNTYFFLQDAWQLHPAWELTAGWRYDHYSDFGSTQNPRLGLVWQMQPRLTAKLLYATAFRAPSYIELYFRNSPSLRGNPRLMPEEIETWETSLNWFPRDDFQTTLTLYHYAVTERIRVVPSADGVLTLTNSGGERGQGLELEALWDITNELRLNLNYAYVKNEINGFEKGIYPNHQVYAALNWLLDPQWQFNTRLNWVGERKPPQGSTRDTLTDYVLLDFILHYQQLDNTGWRWQAGVRNVLDEAPFEWVNSEMPSELPMPERNWFIEARYWFD